MKYGFLTNTRRSTISPRPTDDVTLPQTGAPATQFMLLPPGVILFVIGVIMKFAQRARMRHVREKRKMTALR